MESHDKPRQLSATAALREMRRYASPTRAKHSLRYFKTGPGQYGEGDRFLGLSLPQIRTVSRRFRDLPLKDIDRLLASSWHEARLIALIVLTMQYSRADDRTRARLYRLYVSRTDRINNWDLVDVSAHRIVGPYLLERNRAPLYRMARSRLVWDRRIALIATAHFIRQGQFADTLRLATQLHGDTHDLIHKAMGWMLREVGKKDERALRRYLDRHAGALPRTALRYALERLPASVRKRYMQVPRRRQSH